MVWRSNIMSKCPICETENAPGVLICSFCGTELPEDMTIPLIVIGKDFAPGEAFEGANIKDIAPTITKLLGVEPSEDWEGHSLI